jgi:hypothetical protein
MGDVRLFTSKPYLQELVPPGAPRAYVTSATWLDEEWILSEGEARQGLGCQTGSRPAAVREPVGSREGSLRAPFRDQGVSRSRDGRRVLNPSDRGGRVARTMHCGRAIAGRSGELTVPDEVAFGGPFVRLLRGLTLSCCRRFPTSNRASPMRRRLRRFPSSGRRPEGSARRGVGSERAIVASE